MIPTDCFESIIKEGFNQSSKIIKQSSVLSNGFIEREVKISTDIELDQFFRTYLEEKTSIPVFSEESLGSVDPLKDRCWIVDPIDGSLNFLRNIPFYTSSIALWENGKPLAGFVYDYSHNDYYVGLGLGRAFLNSKPISLSTFQSLNGIVATGIPSHTQVESSLKNFGKLLESYKKIRWLGCASLSMCYVACGKIEAYEELGIKLWDVAAGMAIVQSVGGKLEFHFNEDGSLNLKAIGGALADGK